MWGCFPSDKKTDGNTACLEKVISWPHESTSCATKVGGEEKSEVCSAIATLSKLLVLHFCFGLILGFFLAFLSNYRSKYRPECAC